MNIPMLRSTLCVGALIPYSLLLIVFLDAYEYSLSTRIEKKTQEYEWDKRKRKKEEKKKNHFMPYGLYSLIIISRNADVICFQT